MVLREKDILNAAMKIIAREGYDGASTKQIADEARINEVTLFRKFNSKENLLRAVITQQRDKAIQTLSSTFLRQGAQDNNNNSNTSSIARTLVELGYSLTEFMKDRMDLLILLISEGRRKPFVTKTISSIPQDMIMQLEKVFEEQIHLGKIRRDVDPQLASVIFLGFLFYYSLMKEMFGDKVIKDNGKIIDGFVDLFLNGVATSK
jgi:TetR/AcrR family transcriptional regulator